MDERTMVYLDDVVKVIYQALRTPVPDYHKEPFHDSMGVAMAMANEIPPAQPETFEWCHDCKEYDQEQHCCHRWSQQIRKTSEELEASYPQEIKDELLYWKERAAKWERDYYITVTGIRKHVSNIDLEEVEEDEINKR